MTFTQKIYWITGIMVFLFAVATLLVKPAHAFHVPYAVGDVFAGVGAGKINHYTPAGVLLEVLDTTSGSSEETGMCFDASDNLYSTNFTAQNMTKFNNMGGVITHPWAGPFGIRPESCVVDGSGNIYTGEVDGTEQIRKWDALGNPLGSFSPATGPRGVDWIDLSSDQCTMLYTSEGTAVKRFDVCTNTQLADFAVGLAGPCFALRIRSNGEVMVTCTGQTYRLNPDGSVNMTYPIGGESLFAMNLDPDGTHFWTGGYFTGNIYKVDINTGVGTGAPLFTALPNVSSMAGLAIFGEPTGGKEDTRRMTGGGSVFTKNPGRVTHGFELHCDAAKLPNRLEVNWDKGNKFHLENLTSAVCVNDPALDEEQPVAGFDTYEGKGTGRYNGVSGATAEWKFTDDGEPGTNDLVELQIKDVNNVVVLTVSGVLDRGNHQAHAQ